MSCRGRLGGDWLQSLRVCNLFELQVIAAFLRLLTGYCARFSGFAFVASRLFDVLTRHGPQLVIGACIAPGSRVIMGSASSWARAMCADNEFARQLPFRSQAITPARYLRVFPDSSRATDVERIRPMDGVKVIGKFVCRFDIADAQRPTALPLLNA